MSARIVYAPAAVDDLAGIQGYIEVELCNPIAAIHTLETIFSAIDRLQEAPESGALLSSVLPVHSNYRFLVAGSYMVFYQFYDGTVYINRILYGKRNYIKLLFER